MDDKKKVLKKFGMRVRDYRNKLELSQEELSYRANLHRTYIGMIERGEKNITLLNMIKIANALEISLSKLLEFN